METMKREKKRHEKGSRILSFVEKEVLKGYGDKEEGEKRRNKRK